MGAKDTSRKRRFGNVRKLPSGKYQARYTGPDGLSRTAPTSFATERAAERWLVQTEADILRGDWLDPDGGKVELREYIADWLRERDLKPRTREEYERHIRLHALPHLGGMALSAVGAPTIRTWRTKLLSVGVGRPTVAKTYRILHAVFNTAVDDDLIRRNPCRIKGAATAKADERPMATLDQVFAIAAAIQRRYRVLSSWPPSRSSGSASWSRSAVEASTWSDGAGGAEGNRRDGGRHPSG